MQFELLRDQLHTPDSLLLDVSAHDDYHHDATYLSNPPAAILLAESVDDVVTTVNYCRSHGIPITPRGAGTGLSGGCVATDGALVLSVERLDDLNIDGLNRIAVCGPGVITKDLQDAAAELDLTYPPDPASYEECSLGGNVAECAGGLRCKRFGVTKDYVIGLEAVLADGSLIQTGAFNDYRGFSIGDVLVGSEGTLAIVTRIAVRLTPLPGRGHTLLVAFDSPENAARTVTQINTAGIIPTVMEFLDGDAARCSNRYEQAEGLDDRVAALLLFETTDIDPAGQAARIEAVCRDNGCSYLATEADPDQAESLWRLRRNLSKAVKAASAYRLSEDVAVPNSRFPELVAFVAQMNTDSRLRINSYGHAGDGNLHVNFMADSDSTEDLREIDRWVDSLVQKTLELGGTLTGEHGIGLAKREYLSHEFDPATLSAMRRIKEVLDPTYLFNPDKVFTVEK